MIFYTFHVIRMNEKWKVSTFFIAIFRETLQIRIKINLNVYGHDMYNLADPLIQPSIFMD